MMGWIDSAARAVFVKKFRERTGAIKAIRDPIIPERTANIKTVSISFALIPEKALR